jgi:uncharacterized radical SAM superfamily protein
MYLDMKRVACFRPGPMFPAISITGARCELACPHCAGRPLSAMMPAETPERLLEIARKLAADGAHGFLLSGGCSPEGVLRLDAYIDAIKEIKSTTNLKINAHVGFPRKREAHAIASSKIDAFSVTYPMSDSIGRRYLSVAGAMGRYSETVDALKASGARKVVPHILLGLGDPEEDLEGIRDLSMDPPKALVVLDFIPLRGTPLEGRRPASEAHVIGSFVLMRELMPDTKLVLGCMRPRGRQETEIFLAEQVLDGIAAPSFKTEGLPPGRISFENIEGCCAVHL